MVGLVGITVPRTSSFRAATPLALIPGNKLGTVKEYLPLQSKAQSPSEVMAACLFLRSWLVHLVGKGGWEELSISARTMLGTFSHSHRG